MAAEKWQKDVFVKEKKKRLNDQNFEIWKWMTKLNKFQNSATKMSISLKSEMKEDLILLFLWKILNSCGKMIGICVKILKFVMFDGIF